MKKNYIMSILFVFMIMFSLSVVSANDEVIFENKNNNFEINELDKELPIDEKLVANSDLDKELPIDEKLVANSDLDKELPIDEKLVANSDLDKELPIFDENITSDKNGNVTFKIFAKQNETGNFSIKFNNESRVIQIINSTAMTIFSNVEPGYYKYTIIYNGDENYQSAVMGPLELLNIEDSKTNIVSKSVEMYEKNGTKYKVTLTDSKGKPLIDRNISFKINNRTYNKITDANGVAILSINLISGNYIVESVFNGDDLYPSSSNINNITILSRLLSDNLTKFYKNDSQYRVEVLDGKGNPLANVEVSININGVFYYKTTDSNGIAKLNINLNPGNYIITAEVENGLKISTNIEVLKTLEGKNLTKTFDGNETYDVEVLDGKGNPLANVEVSININGVFYYKITDSNGIAKLNINLNPGNYIATAFYNGYSTSNAVEIK